MQYLYNSTVYLSLGKNEKSHALPGKAKRNGNKGVLKHSTFAFIRGIIISSYMGHEKSARNVRTDSR